MKQDLSFEMLAGGLEYLLVLDQLSAVDQDLSLVMLAGRGNVCWYRNSRLWSGICCLGGGEGGMFAVQEQSPVEGNLLLVVLWYI